MFYFGKEKNQQKLQFNKKLLILTAPIAGYTRYSFRKIVERFNPDIVYTEMLSVKSVIYNNKEFYKIIKKDREDKIGIQLFGCDPEDFVKAIDTIIKYDSSYNLFDINMGCPVKKVIKTGAGAALLRDPSRIYRIVSSIKRNFASIILSCKIRIGFDNESKNYLEVSKAIEDGGADFITVHGRTRTQFYRGNVDYEAIRITKENVKIPVIANGNIFTPEDAKKVLEKTGANGVMLARGVIGNPFLIKQIRDFLEMGSYKEPTLREIIDIFVDHFNLERDEWHEFKKIGICYLKGLPNCTDFRRRIAISKTFEEIEKVVNDIKEKYIDECGKRVLYHS